MSKKIGILDYNIYPQPGFQAQRDEKGGWTASADFNITTTTWAQASWRARFAKGESIISLDPTLDPFFSFLTISSQTITRNEGGVMTISVECGGSGINQYDDGELDDGSLPTYRLEGRISEAPFSDHPKWKDLSNTEKFALGLLLNGDAVAKPDFTGVGSYNDNGEWQPWEDGSGEIVLTGNAVEFSKRIAQGQSTYLVPTVVYTESTQGSSGMTPQQLNLLGRISNPRGNPPTASGSRNWMLTGASQEQRGDLYQTSVEWTLSAREGHDSFLYS